MVSAPAQLTLPKPDLRLLGGEEMSGAEKTMGREACMLRRAVPLDKAERGETSSLDCGEDEGA